MSRRTERVTTTVEYWRRRKAGLLPGLVGLLGVAALLGVQLLGFRPGVEDDLAGRTRQALAAQGLDAVQVSVSGRDVTLSGGTTEQLNAAQAATRDVNGVRVALQGTGDGTASGDQGSPNPTTAGPTTEAPTSAAPTSASPSPKPSAATPAAPKPTKAPPEVLKSRFRAFPKISFEANSSTLTPQGRAAVGRIAKILSPSKFGVRVKVVGHTDLDGSAAVNRRLSAARARAVVMELMRKGVPSARLSASGVGESQPLVSPERTAADKATNRRVEFLPII